MMISCLRSENKFRSYFELRSAQKINNTIEKWGAGQHEGLCLFL